MMKKLIGWFKKVFKIETFYINLGNQGSYYKKNEILSTSYQKIKVVECRDYTNWRIFLNWLGFNMHFEQLKVKPYGR